jgi:NTP pyrophosphatase (non-canonical NTP hydrolase)
MENDMEELIELIEQWSIDKGIKEKATLRKQYEKMQEEVEEVYEAIYEIENHGFDGHTTGHDALLKINNELDLEIGDVVVTAIILAQLHGTNIEACLEKAYNKISKRTGKMINGTFVKSEDLPK